MNLLIKTTEIKKGLKPSIGAASSPIDRFEFSNRNQQMLLTVNTHQGTP